MVDSVDQITPELLHRHGARGVLVDIDDTLLAAAAEALEPSASEWLGRLKQAGFPIVLLSNGERGRVRRLADELGVRALHLAGKPFGFAFRRALVLLGTPAASTAMIGDQLFTDVLGANAAGLTSILVRPLSPGKLPHTRLARVVERMILKGGARGRPVHR